MKIKVFGTGWEERYLDSQLCGVTTTPKKDHSGMFHVAEIIDVLVRSEELAVMVRPLDEDMPKAEVVALEEPVRFAVAERPKLVVDIPESEKPFHGPLSPPEIRCAWQREDGTVACCKHERKDHRHYGCMAREGVKYCPCAKNGDNAADQPGKPQSPEPGPEAVGF
jgi:hypothetical protein